MFLGDIMPLPGDVELSVHPDVRAAIGAADLVIANCEAPLGRETRTRGTRFWLGEREFGRVLGALNVLPERAAVSLANNHAEDHGPAQLAQTAARLGDMGCRVIGLREGAADIPAAAIDVSGHRLGIAAWTQWRNRPARTASIRPWETDDVLAASWPDLVSSAGIDLLIGVPHWDLEFRHFPQPGTRALARRMGERGFRLLVGHHSHVIQGAERFGNLVVFYSSGNAVPNEFCTRPWTGRLGLLIQVELACDARQVTRYEVRPLTFARERRRMVIDFLRPESGADARLRKRFDLVFPPQARSEHPGDA